jgi:hypothetical protein
MSTTLRSPTAPERTAPTLRQVLELPTLSCRHFSNVPAFVIFAGIFWVCANNSHRFLGKFSKVPAMLSITGTLSSASSRFRGKFSKVPAMLSITGTLSICLQMFSWQIFKSAGNAQYYRHFIDMPPDVFVANLQKCRQCSL